ncbi:hypothetical protein GCM10022251_14980 [Phytohabitans flavus]|uniref:Uncharacterized protein n=1 Tax=Phytohabitans flavus TaxID=1076124 RepID=A0A6F8Y6W3_9ACTN|nr:hypothetical protein [Phytohabitans flavus]BCB81769.1 hypothetical protein Pflav_081790 [Phytohabitans flavus]
MVTGEALVELTAVSALLLIAGCVVFGMVLLAAIAERPRRQPRPDVVKLRAAARELAAHAGHTHAVAGRAAAAAIEARERLAASEEARDAAWRAQEAAGAAYQVAWGTAAAERDAAAGRDSATVDLELVVAGDVEGPDGDRQRDVSRAALSAYRRGELSVEELREVWRRAGDWAPEQEERERRADHLRAEELAARRDYERAAMFARQAAEALWVAETQSRAMAAEAMAAATEAHEALLVTQRFAGKGKGKKKRRRKR